MVCSKADQVLPGRAKSGILPGSIKALWQFLPSLFGERLGLPISGLLRAFSLHLLGEPRKVASQSFGPGHACCDIFQVSPEAIHKESGGILECNGSDCPEWQKSRLGVRERLRHFQWGSPIVRNGLRRPKNATGRFFNIVLAE